MDRQQSILYKKYIDLFYRWKIVLLILFLISLPVGLLLYLKQPKIYQAESAEESPTVT